MKLPNLISKSGRLYQKLRRRRGTKPGLFDVSCILTGEAFYATPNFYYFEDCGRPCWLPLNPAPKRGGPNWAVTDGWPSEINPDHLIIQLQPSGYISALHKMDHGDKVLVVGEVRGEIARDEVGNKSDLWYVIACPPDKVVRNAHLIKERDNEGNYIVYANSLWLGNTGSHGISYTMPQATLDLLET